MSVGSIDKHAYSRVVAAGTDQWGNTPTNLKRSDVDAVAMFAAAKELGVSIRWGADWDGDGKPRERGESDSPHFELA
jgi:hypothetical protein